MKILIISNLYPPYYIGGYELGCSRVVDALRAKGHIIKVLTSTYGVNEVRREEDVYRWIPINFNFRTNRSLKRVVELSWFDHAGRKAFRKIYQEFKPDVVYVWNMAHLSVSIAILAQSLQAKVCFYISNHWLASWERDVWYRLWHSFFKKKLRLANVQFVSNSIKEDVIKAGKPIESSSVVYWGVDPNIFRFRNQSSRGHLKLLFVGQVIGHKGPHIILEALKILVHEYGIKDWQLSVVGGTTDNKYLQNLIKMAQDGGIAAHITWVGFVPAEDLPAVYADHDVLIFSSIWQEPFSITLVEAMSCGLGIITTMTGGTPEIVEPEHNALTYESLDFEDCARQIARVYSDRRLLRNLGQQARKTVEERFRFDKMVDQIEAMLWLREDKSENKTSC